MAVDSSDFRIRQIFDPSGIVLGSDRSFGVMERRAKKTKSKEKGSCRMLPVMHPDAAGVDSWYEASA